MRGWGGANSVTDAKLDANDVWYLVATYYVDHSEAPTVTFEGGEYNVNGQTIEAKLENPEFEFTSNDPDNWCVTITYNDGAAAVSVDPEDNIQESAGC